MLLVAVGPCISILPEILQRSIILVKAGSPKGSPLGNPVGDALSVWMTERPALRQTFVVVALGCVL